jgi:hypothetical protein
MTFGAKLSQVPTSMGWALQPAKQAQAFSLGCNPRINDETFCSP